MHANQPRRAVGKKERLRAARAQAEGREHHVPVRKVIVRSPVRILRELASVKMRCKVPCESAIEYDHFVVLDVRQDVRAFQAQPELLHYTDSDGNCRKHFPDARVELGSGAVEFHEVKPDKEADDPAFRRLHTAIAVEYAKRGSRHLVMRESEVRRQPRLANAMLLRSVRVRQPTWRMVEQMHEVLASGGRTFGDLQAMLGRGAEGGADLMALALRGLVDLDWERIPIGPDIPVVLPRTGGKRR